MCIPVMWLGSGWHAGARTRKSSSVSWPRCEGLNSDSSKRARRCLVATMNVPQTPLARLLRRQRVLAWVLSTLTLTLTVVFFAMMTLAAPLLSRVAFGRSITIANAAALVIILVFLGSIGLFGWQAGRIDQQLSDARKQR